MKETFYRLLFLEDKHAFAEQAVALAQRLADIADERYRAGDSPSWTSISPVLRCTMCAGSVLKSSVS